MFEGVLTALVTPFKNGEVVEEQLRHLVERQIEAGVDGLVPCGTTGESATLTHAEHNRVVEIVVAAAAGRVQVVAGTGSNNTAEAIELTKHAKAAGADGALLISPYYNRPTQAGIVAHYDAVSSAVALPLLVYNVEARTASNIQPETLPLLAAIDHVVGIKACGKLDDIAKAIALCPPDFTTVSGDDSQTLPLLALGGDGVISTTSNVAPREMVEMVRAFRAGDTARARELHYHLMPLFEVLFCETNPIPLKCALALMGLVGEEIRLPMTAATQSTRDRLQVTLKELGFL